MEAGPALQAVGRDTTRGGWHRGGDTGRAISRGAATRPGGSVTGGGAVAPKARGRSELEPPHQGSASLPARHTATPSVCVYQPAPSDHEAPLFPAPWSTLICSQRRRRLERPLTLDAGAIAPFTSYGRFLRHTRLSPSPRARGSGRGSRAVLARSPGVGAAVY